MNNLQKKSLEHIKKVLVEFDTFNVYSAVSDAMKKHDIDEGVKHKILNVLQDEIYKEKSKVEEAKAWVETIISDSK